MFLHNRNSARTIFAGPWYAVTAFEDPVALLDM
jgi:hypothetical protein